MSTRPEGRRYNFAENAPMNRSRDEGNYFLKKGAKVGMHRLEWNKGSTVFRILPALVPGTNEFYPWKLSEAATDFSDWIRWYPAVRNFGNPSISMFLYDSTDMTYDPRTNPCNLLYSAIKRAVDANPTCPWRTLLDKNAGSSGPQLSRPGDVALVQVFLFQRGLNFFSPALGSDPGSDTAVMCIPGSAMVDLIDTMLAPTPNYTGDPSNYEQAYLMGDPVSLEYGAFCHVFNKQNDPRAFQASASGNPYAPSGRPATLPRANTKEFNGYASFLTKTLTVPSNPPYTYAASLLEHRDRVAAVVKPWDQIVNFFSDEEQVLKLCGAFTADVIMYALGDRWSQIIPTSVKDRAINPSAVVVPHGQFIPANPYAMANPYGQQPPVNPYGQQPPVNPYGQQPPVQQPPTNPYGQQPLVQQPPVQQPPVQQPSANPYGQQPPANPYGQRPVQPPANPYGQQPPANPYGQQPPTNPYGQQPLANPYGQQPPVQQPPANPYGQQSPANPYGQLPVAAEPQVSSVYPPSEVSPPPGPPVVAAPQQPLVTDTNAVLERIRAARTATNPPQSQ